VSSIRRRWSNPMSQPVPDGGAFLALAIPERAALQPIFLVWHGFGQGGVDIFESRVWGMR
jgi:hypothetical protein